MDRVVIIDFGSQVTQLIARRLREFGIYCHIVSYSNISIHELEKDYTLAIILSGGPRSVYDTNAPHIDKKILSLGKPLLGICYGLQLICYYKNANVKATKKREYGKAFLSITKQHSLFENIPQKSIIWMSHGDSVLSLPKGFKKIAETTSAPYASIVNDTEKIYGVQFHPEVTHSEYGKQVLKNFLFKICKLKPNWTSEAFIDSATNKIKETTQGRSVLCGLSGGVDSSVTAALIHKAIGNKLQCVFVDTGLLRKKERENVSHAFRKSLPDLNIHFEDSSALFLSKLKGVTDPEEKRKIIGTLFIDVFTKCANKLGSFSFLAQGTLYPDVIESVSIHGEVSQTIKSHHNVGGLPEKLNFQLLEPLRELFKDEVRDIAGLLNLPLSFIQRHPFPGPGLAIRILSDITKEKVHTLQEADAIFIEELKKNNEYQNIWQAFTVLLPIKSVGVMGDKRTYENTCVLRAVTSVDGMTANWYPLPFDLLEHISNRIINEVEGINRVVYDISSKPPATIEWE